MFAVQIDSYGIEESQNKSLEFSVGWHGYEY